MSGYKRFFTIRALKIGIYQLRMKWQQFTDSLLSANRRKQLHRTDFSVISDTCLAGIGIYHKFGLEYSTPTVGLFFYPEDYLTFVENFDNLINEPLTFKKTFRDGKPVPYPVGVLGNKTEIQFVHYKSEKEAAEKWARRCKRINFDNLYFIFSDREGFNKDHVERFAKLPYKNKIFFSSRSCPDYSDLVVFVKDYSHQDRVGMSCVNRVYEKYFNVVAWLNGEKNYMKQGSR